MDRRDYVFLVAAIALGGVAGVIVGGVAALASGLALLTVFGGVAGSYLGMVYADWHWGPRSRKVREKRAAEARRLAAEAERAERSRQRAERGTEAGSRAGVGRAGESRRPGRRSAARTRR